MVKIFKILNIIFKYLTGLLLFIITIYGVLVYTIEYTKEDSRLKAFFEYEFDVSYTISVLLIFIIFTIVSFGLQQFFKKIIKLIESNEFKSNNNEEIQIQNSKIHSEEELKNTIVKFADLYSSVISVQLYKYKETLHSKEIFYDIYPTLVMYVKENYSINLVRERYKISRTDIDKYIKARDAYLSGDFEALAKYISEMTNYFKKFNGAIPKKSNERDTIKFALLILASQQLMGSYPTLIKDIDPEVFSYFLTSKRTGFLRSIIEGDFYKFVHEGNNDKKNRSYIVKPFYLENTPYLFVITVNHDTLDKLQLNSYLDDTAEKFYDILNRELGVVKSDYKVGGGSHVYSN